MSSPSLSPTRLVGAAVAAACAVFAAQAEEFSWQLSGAMRRFDDSDSWAVDATYYMNPIADSTGPYALASFLNPTTRVSATASKTVSAQPTAYTLSGAYVLPGEKWYVGGNYAKLDVGDASSVTLADPKDYGVLAGRYLGANTTLELRLDRFEQKSSLACPNPVCSGLPLEIDLTRDSVGLEVFHVRRFRSLTYSLQGSVSESKNDIEMRPQPLGFVSLDGSSVRLYSVAAELFPTDRLGVRVGYSRPDSDFNLDGYDLAATWFFKPRVAVQFGLSRTNIDGAPPGLGHYDSAAVRFIGRL